VIRFLSFFVASALGLCAQTMPSLLNSAGQQASVPADRVVATVDGKDVTAGEVRQALSTLPPEFTQLFNQNPQYAIQQMFMMNYLASEAEKQKLGEQSPLKEQLAAQRANALAAAMLTWEQNSYKPPAEALADYYTKNQANYKQSKGKIIAIAFKPSNPPVVKAGQDMQAAIEAAARATQRTESDAEARANEVVQKARGGADFESLVAEYSDDPVTKKEKGASVINYKSVPEMKSAIFPLAAGQIAGPIKRENVFLIFKVEEVAVQPQSEVLEDIYQQLRAAHVREWFEGITRRFTPAVKAPEFFGAQGQQMTPSGPRP
jgi:peptidyl-prolyl cis-trans isomerase C